MDPPSIDLHFFRSECGPTHLIHKPFSTYLQKIYLKPITDDHFQEFEIRGQIMRISDRARNSKMVNRGITIG